MVSGCTPALSENVRQRDEDLKQTVQKLAVRDTAEAVAELISRRKVIEIAGERERFEAIAQDYAKNPNDALVISPADRERRELNSLIHRELQREGIVSRTDQQTTVYVSCPDMTGAERTFANSYRPNEDIIRYNSASEKLKVTSCKPQSYDGHIRSSCERRETQSSEQGCRDDYAWHSQGSALA